MIDGPLGRAVQALAAMVLRFLPRARCSALGQAALGAAASYTSEGIEHLAGLGYTLAGVAALFAIARWIECRNTFAPSHARTRFHSAAAEAL